MTIIRVRKVVVRLAVTVLVAIFALAFSPGLAAANLPPHGEGVPPLVFQGGWVQYHPKVYLVFWGPKWAQDQAHIEAMTKTREVFDNLAGSSYNNVLRQYTNQTADPNGFVHNDVQLMGTWNDPTTPGDGLFMGLENAEPLNAGVGAELQDEAVNAHSHWNLPADKNIQILIFPQQGSTYGNLMVPSPSGGPPIIFSFMNQACGMHTYEPDHQIAYAFVRYASDLGGCNPTGNVAKNIAWTATHEYAEMATDPHIYFNPFGSGSWVHGSGWATNESDITPHEVSDLCEGWDTGNSSPTYRTPGGAGATSVDLTIPYQWDAGTSSCSTTSGESFWSPDPSSIYKHKHTVQNGILSSYYSGSNRSLLGAPLSEETPIAGGAVSYFAEQVCAGGYTIPDAQNGGAGIVSGSAIYWSAQSNAHEVHGCIYQKYTSSGGPGGPLGFPLSDEYAIVDGRQSDFQNGYITFDNSTGQSEVHVGGGEPTVIRNKDGRLEVFEWRSDHIIWHKWQTTANGSWSWWESMGSSLAGRPAAALNEDGRLEIFARGTDGALWHNWQTSAGGNWSGWYSLGGTFRQNPAATWTVSGRLEVFIRGTDDLYYYNRQASPGGAWSGWSAIGTCCGHSNPGLVLDTFGQPHVFMTEANGVVWTKWQFSNGNWSGWDTLGCCAKSEPVLSRNYNGTLEVFIRGTDNQLYHKWETSRGGSWSGWAGLSGALTSTPTAAINITVGTLEVFVRGTDNGVWHMWQGSPSGNWSGWAGLGGGLTSAPVVFPNYDGRLEIFARGTDGNLYHCWQTTPAGGWTGWSIL